ncbi:MAG: Ig-like domain-containing protein, partial [Bacteroidales bacterium]|nr:Ig-like domain-containing protein [Bacteroidales bacterium]
MKGLQIAIGLLAVAALSSCQVKEELLPTEETPRFHAIIEQPGQDASTKTYVDKEIFDATGSYTIFWYRDDRVSIFYDNTYNQQYSFEDRDGSTAGDFKIVTGTGSGSTAQAIVTGNNYAITPYHRDNRCDTQGNLTVVIPERQEYYQDDRRGIGVHLLMVAKDTDGDKDFFFKHVGSYLGVRLRGEGVSVKSITLRGNNGETLAGYPIVSFDENDDPEISFDPRDLDNFDFVTMELSEPKTLTADEYEYFWLTLPAVTFDKGFSLTVKDEHGGTYVREVTKSTTLNRKGFYTLSCDVEIASIPVESITVDPTNLTLTMTETETATLKATVLPADATDPTVTWSSDNEEVATVSADGVVTAHKSGTANITAKAGDKEATCVVYVVDKVSYS